jgi:phenylalanyl-tRNA synthetase beta chain
VKISRNWLADYVDFPWPAEQIPDKLAQLGFPVASTETTGVQAKGVIAVKILTVEKHPNADRLRIAKVTDGKTERTIVCGAPNIAAGQTVPCAIPGAKLPGGIEITQSKIRGVESAGMLCSERELGLSGNHAGILQLPAESALGTEVSEIFGGGDVVWDIEVTPNRPDMLSYLGVARELATLANVPLKKPALYSGVSSDSQSCPIAIDDIAGCSLYIARLIKNVTVAPSPDWMVRRLTASGIRPINNVVDITNYVLLEFGHPLHAFDLALLDGPEIRVRRAQDNEQFLALDGRTYALKPADLVIADRQKAVAIAGVMGGEKSGVSAQTKTILLESAVFDRVSVRNTSKRLALRSESSIRFEKGTDAATARAASLRAVQLIAELAHGETAAEQQMGATSSAPTTITLRRSVLTQKAGMDFNDAQVTGILKRLELSPVKSGDVWQCSIPAHRKDLVEEIDLIEEVLRFTGYDAVPARVAISQLGTVPADYAPNDLSRLIAVLTGLGFNEAVTNSFSAESAATPLGFAVNQLVYLANPLAQDEATLRPHLLSTLLPAVARNLNRQQTRVPLFEAGTVFTRVPGHVREEKRLALVWAGTVFPQTPFQKEQLIDVLMLKGFVETLLRAFRIDGKLVAPTSKAPIYLHPYQCLELTAGNKSVGVGGMLHPTAAQAFGIKAPCAVFDVKLDLFGAPAPASAREIPKHSFVERDIAVVVGQDTPWASLQKAASSAAGALLQSIAPFDIFSGGELLADQKSVAFRMTLRADDRTLTDAEITKVVDAVKQRLQSECSARLR